MVSLFSVGELSDRIPICPSGYVITVAHNGYSVVGEKVPSLYMENGTTFGRVFLKNFLKNKKESIAGQAIGSANHRCSVYLVEIVVVILNWTRIG